MELIENVSSRPGWSSLREYTLPPGLSYEYRRYKDAVEALSQYLQIVTRPDSGVAEDPALTQLLEKLIQPGGCKVDVHRYQIRFPMAGPYAEPSYLDEIRALYEPINLPPYVKVCIHDYLEGSHCEKTFKLPRPIAGIRANLESKMSEVRVARPRGLESLEFAVQRAAVEELSSLLHSQSMFQPDDFSSRADTCGVWQPDIEQRINFAAGFSSFDAVLLCVRYFHEALLDGGYDDEKRYGPV